MSNSQLIYKRDWIDYHSMITQSIQLEFSFDIILRVPLPSVFFTFVLRGKL